MKQQHYYIYKKGEERSIVYLDYDKINGYTFTPKNNVKYDGVKVNTVVVINQSMIEKVLKRKIKNKLDLYLKLIIKSITDDSDDDNGEAYKEALNNLSRYRSIVLNKYYKYLDETYLKLLLKKIAVLEYELTKKLNIKEEIIERETHRRR